MAALQLPPLPEPYAEQQVHRTHNHYRSRVDDLDDPILELIFTSLFQWKHITTCKCVSKRWNSIISNPDFVRVLSRECFPFTLLIRRGLEKYLITEHPFFQKHKLGFDFLPAVSRYCYSNPEDINIVAHHKDVFVSYCIHNNNESAYYFIANPLTKQYIEVPLTFTRAVHGLPDFYNCYNIWPDHGEVGFAGHVPGVSSASGNSDGFRIVRIIDLCRTFGRPTQFFLQIYSSQTGQWKTYPKNSLYFSFNSLTTFNNKVYSHDRSQILVIDPFVDIVTPRLLKLPEKIPPRSVLGVCRNQLRIAHVEAEQVGSEYSPKIKVWELKENFDGLDNDKLGLRLVIDFAVKQSFVPHSYSDACRVVCCHPNDPDVVYFFYLDNLFYCDVIRKELKVVAHFTADPYYESFVFLHPLVTPRGGTRNEIYLGLDL